MRKKYLNFENEFRNFATAFDFRFYQWTINPIAVQSLQILKKKIREKRLNETSLIQRHQITPHKFQQSHDTKSKRKLQLFLLFIRRSIPRKEKELSFANPNFFQILDLGRNISASAVSFDFLILATIKPSFHYAKLWRGTIQQNPSPFSKRNSNSSMVPSTIIVLLSSFPKYCPSAPDHSLVHYFL